MKRSLYLLKIFLAFFLLLSGLVFLFRYRQGNGEPFGAALISIGITILWADWRAPRP